MDSISYAGPPSGDGGYDCNFPGADLEVCRGDSGSRGIVLPADYRYPEYPDMPRLTDDESFVRSRLKRDGVKVARE
jgi:hypothetical protein